MPIETHEILDFYQYTLEWCLIKQSVLPFDYDIDQQKFVYIWKVKVLKEYSHQ
ncbi:hypothetical protein J7E52_03820 [Bacillus sp. ISL-34]|uniref:hypothetical protein n=1 Tax=Bacillus sp. ISL-34 TaxID=2819121 RepID=UPI001BECBE44|nr:hypothetical protein [Bacillus sp. ISL-34]MBT2645858.1 hypothetical protein [Bacillus sp. ISL-34]